MTYRLSDFYRNVLVFLPFSATALGIFTIAALILLEWWRRNHVTQVIIRFLSFRAMAYCTTIYLKCTQFNILMCC